MKKFLVVLLVVLVLAGVGYYFRGDILEFVGGLWGDVAAGGDGGEEGEEGEEEEENYDNFPLKSFIGRKYDVKELGEHGMVLEVETGTSAGMKHIPIYVYGVDPDRESLLEGVTALDFKVAHYRAVSEENSNSWQHTETTRVMMLLYKGIPRQWRVALLRPVTQLDIYVREIIANNPNITAEEIQRIVDEEFPVRFSSFEEATKAVRFDTESVTIHNSSGTWRLVERGGHLVVEDFWERERGDEELLKDIYWEYLESIAHWDGESEAIVMYNPGMKFEGGSAIFPYLEYIHDIRFNPELPRDLFAPPV